MNQNDVVLKHLKDSPKGITSMQAFSEYGITRISARIYDLRGKGHKIGTEMIDGKYARYFLASA